MLQNQQQRQNSMKAHNLNAASRIVTSLNIYSNCKIQSHHHINKQKTRDQNNLELSGAPLGGNQQLGNWHSAKSIKYYCKQNNTNGTIGSKIGNDGGKYKTVANLGCRNPQGKMNEYGIECENGEQVQRILQNQCTYEGIHIPKYADKPTHFKQNKGYTISKNTKTNQTRPYSQNIDPYNTADPPFLNNNQVLNSEKGHRMNGKYSELIVITSDMELEQQMDKWVQNKRTGRCSDKPRFTCTSAYAFDKQGNTNKQETGLQRQTELQIVSPKQREFRIMLNKYKSNNQYLQNQVRQIYKMHRLLQCRDQERELRAQIQQKQSKIRKFRKQLSQIRHTQFRSKENTRKLKEIQALIDKQRHLCYELQLRDQYMDEQIDRFKHYVQVADNQLNECIANTKLKQCGSLTHKNRDYQYRQAKQAEEPHSIKHNYCGQGSKQCVLKSQTQLEMVYSNSPFKEIAQEDSQSQNQSSNIISIYNNQLTAGDHPNTHKHPIDEDEHRQMNKTKIVYENKGHLQIRKKEGKGNESKVLNITNNSDNRQNILNRYRDDGIVGMSEISQIIHKSQGLKNINYTTSKQPGTSTNQQQSICQTNQKIYGSSASNSYIKKYATINSYLKTNNSANEEGSINNTDAGIYYKRTARPLVATNSKKNLHIQKSESNDYYNISIQKNTNKYGSYAHHNRSSSKTKRIKLQKQERRECQYKKLLEQRVRILKQNIVCMRRDLHRRAQSLQKQKICIKKNIQLFKLDCIKAQTQNRKINKLNYRKSLSNTQQHVNVRPMPISNSLNIHRSQANHSLSSHMLNKNIGNRFGIKDRTFIRNMSQGKGKLLVTNNYADEYKVGRYMNKIKTQQTQYYQPELQYQSQQSYSQKVHSEQQQHEYQQQDVINEGQYQARHDDLQLYDEYGRQNEYSNRIGSRMQIRNIYTSRQIHHKGYDEYQIPLNQARNTQKCNMQTSNSNRIVKKMRSYHKVSLYRYSQGRNSIRSGNTLSKSKLKPISLYSNIKEDRRVSPNVQITKLKFKQNALVKGNSDCYQNYSIQYGIKPNSDNCSPNHPSTRPN